MDTFYVREPFWLSFDRFYKVYVNDSTLYGAWLAGEIYDNASSKRFVASAQIFAPLASLWCKRRIRQRQEREQQYDSMDLASPDFLKRDKRNFEIARRDILRVEMEERRWSFWVGTNVTGILRITTRIQGTRKFILVGDQVASHVKALLTGNA